MKRPPSQAAVSFVLAIADEISLGTDGTLRCIAETAAKWQSKAGRYLFHRAPLCSFLLECLP